MDDPYRNVRRGPDFQNLWFGAVPNTMNSDGQVVTCSYWILEGEHAVRCDSIVTLSPPF